MTASEPSPKRRRWVFSLRTLFLVTTLFAVVGAVVHWFFIRERPYLYLTSDDKDAVIYLDEVPLGKPPISLMRRDIERLFPGEKTTVDKRRLRMTPTQFGAFILSIQREDGSKPLLWVDGPSDSKLQLKMPRGQAILPVFTQDPWLWDAIRISEETWHSSHPSDIPRGYCNLSQASFGEDISARLVFPEKSLVGYYHEIQTLKEDSEAVLTLWRRTAPLRSFYHRLPVKGSDWFDAEDGATVAIRFPLPPAGEYWLEGCLHNDDREYYYEDTFVSVWFRVTNDGRLVTMETLEDAHVPVHDARPIDRLGGR